MALHRSTSKVADSESSGSVTESEIQQVSLKADLESARDEAIETAPTDTRLDPIPLDRVIESIYQTYPLLRMALRNRQLASGERLSADGEFDFKLKAGTENQPMGFYQTYRHGLSGEQPLWGGGSVYGGYRVGRGTFEPWYGNRQTNDGGEFALGAAVPLLQNRAIDERRARILRTTFGVTAVEPEIQTEMLEFVREGSVAYWNWVAAGLQVRYAEELLKLSVDRDEQITEQVDAGRRAEPDLVDNRRLIRSREVKQLDALRKLQTSAVKLSLFLRQWDGTTYEPTPAELPDGFPEPPPIRRELLDQDISLARARRPEMRYLLLQRQMLDVDLSRAQNELLPQLDASLYASQDFGARSTSTGDKTPFEISSGVTFSVPVQRRKATGKIMQLEGKISQNSAKRQFQSDKVATEVEASVISLDLAYQSILKAREAIELNAEMERIEDEMLLEGRSDLLRVNLRETATFDARVTEVDALLRYYDALADYRAATAADLPYIPDMAEPLLIEEPTVISTVSP